MITKTEGTVFVSDIVAGRNAREAVGIDHIYDDMVQNGLREAISLIKGTNELLRGSCRTAAIRHMEENHPEAFKKWFAKGVSCVFVEGTDAEMAMYRIDHNDKRPLSLNCEVQRAFDDLLDNGVKEAEIVLQCAGLIESKSPLTQEQRIRLKVSREEGGEKAYRKALAEIRHGFFQPRKRVYDLPGIVRDTLRYQEVGGDLPKGVKVKEDLPKLSNKLTVKLLDAFKKDMNAVNPKTGLPVFSKEHPGSNFLEVWNTLVTQWQKKQAEGGKKGPTKLSAAQMTEKAAKLESGILKRVLLEAAGADKIVPIDASIDEDVRDLELTRDYDPAFYQKFKANAKRLRKDEKERLAKKLQEIKDTAKNKVKK